MKSQKRLGGHLLFQVLTMMGILIFQSHSSYARGKINLSDVHLGDFQSHCEIAAKTLKEELNTEVTWDARSKNEMPLKGGNDKPLVGEDGAEIRVTPWGCFITIQGSSEKEINPYNLKEKLNPKGHLFVPYDWGNSSGREITKAEINRIQNLYKESFEFNLQASCQNQRGIYFECGDEVTCRKAGKESNKLVSIFSSFASPERASESCASNALKVCNYSKATIDLVNPNEDKLGNTVIDFPVGGRINTGECNNQVGSNYVIINATTDSKFTAANMVNVGNTNLGDSPEILRARLKVVESKLSEIIPTIAVLTSNTNPKEWANNTTLSVIASCLKGATIDIGNQLHEGGKFLKEHTGSAMQFVLSYIGLGGGGDKSEDEQKKIQALINETDKSKIENITSVNSEYLKNLERESVELQEERTAIYKKLGAQIPPLNLPKSTTNFASPNLSTNAAMMLAIYKQVKEGREISDEEAARETCNIIGSIALVTDGTVGLGVLTYKIGRAVYKLYGVVKIASKEWAVLIRGKSVTLKPLSEVTNTNIAGLSPKEDPLLVTEGKTNPKINNESEPVASTNKTNTTNSEKKWWYDPELRKSRFMTEEEIKALQSRVNNKVHSNDTNPKVVNKNVDPNATTEWYNPKTNRYESKTTAEIKEIQNKGKSDKPQVTSGSKNSDSYVSEDGTLKVKTQEKPAPDWFKVADEEKPITPKVAEEKPGVFKKLFSRIWPPKNSNVPVTKPNVVNTDKPAPSWFKVANEKPEVPISDVPNTKEVNLHPPGPMVALTSNLKPEVEKMKNKIQIPGNQNDSSNSKSPLLLSEKTTQTTNSPTKIPEDATGKDISKTKVTLNQNQPQEFLPSGKPFVVPEDSDLRSGTSNSLANQESTETYRDYAETVKVIQEMFNQQKDLESRLSRFKKMKGDKTVSVRRLTKEFMRAVKVSNVKVSKAFLEDLKRIKHWTFEELMEKIFCCSVDGCASRAMPVNSRAPSSTSGNKIVNRAQPSPSGCGS